jgi:hypothetical protein
VTWSPQRPLDPAPLLVASVALLASENHTTKSPRMPIAKLAQNLPPPPQARAIPTSSALLSANEGGANAWSAFQICHCLVFFQVDVSIWRT